MAADAIQAVHMGKDGGLAFTHFILSSDGVNFYEQASLNSFSSSTTGIAFWLLNP